MGAGASAIPMHIDKNMFRQLCGGTINDAIFDANSVDGVMTRDRLMELSNMRDCFLSHEEGKDSVGRSIPERVQRINLALKARGLMTWMGEKGAGQQVVQQVCSGIDKSRCMIAFITKGYIDRVNKNVPTDSVGMEFNYNLRRKHPHNIIPVVMESQVADSSKWPGPVGQVLGDLHRFSTQLEETTINALRHFGIMGERSDVNTGVWVGKNKISAVGLTASRWITMHGISLNVNCDLRHFEEIVPCGIRQADRGVCSIQGLHNTFASHLSGESFAYEDESMVSAAEGVDVEAVADKWIDSFAQVFNVDIIDQEKITSSRGSNAYAKEVESRRIQSRQELDALVALYPNIAELEVEYYTSPPIEE